MTVCIRKACHIATSFGKKEIYAVWCRGNAVEFRENIRLEPQPGQSPILTSLAWYHAFQ